MWCLVSVLLALLLSCAASSRAQDLTFTLDPSTLDGPWNSDVVFSGTLDNTLGSTVVFDGFSVSLDGFDPSDISVLFDFADLVNGGSRTTDFFSVHIPNGKIVGEYAGTAMLFYHYGGGPTYDTRDSNFTVNVTPTPPSLLVGIVGAAGMGLYAWRGRTTCRKRDGAS